MTDKQKRIYNMYLQASSLGVGHPFKMRKDFDGFEDEKPEEYVAILKLEKLFDDLPGLNIYDYFSAPYKFDRTNTGRMFELKWYLGFMAMKAYKNMFYQQFEHNTLSNEDTKNDIERDFDRIAERIRSGFPLKKILVSEDPTEAPKWIDLYCKHFISDWFIIAFRMIGKDLIGMMPPMFRDGIVSDDHLEFIEKNVSKLENPQLWKDKKFLTDQIRKLIEAEKARNNLVDKEK